MKRINAKWLNKDDNYESLSELIDNHNFIGFIPDENKNLRYMICGGGNVVGMAVNCSGNWATIGGQKKEPGQYFVFESKFDLYEWVSHENN